MKEEMFTFFFFVGSGLKYLHSAGILHRDIKPGNLLVNSNCLLKVNQHVCLLFQQLIPDLPFMQTVAVFSGAQSTRSFVSGQICDFGLARVEEPDPSRHMTQEVVTQYYRAPEVLMGCRHYGSAIDVWSVGCIFAELLGRRILFQAQSPIQQVRAGQRNQLINQDTLIHTTRVNNQMTSSGTFFNKASVWLQLDLITDLLGTPPLSALASACEGARAHILRGPHKPVRDCVVHHTGGASEALQEQCVVSCFNCSWGPGNLDHSEANLPHFHK